MSKVTVDSTIELMQDVHKFLKAAQSAGLTDKSTQKAGKSIINRDTFNEEL